MRKKPFEMRIYNRTHGGIYLNKCGFKTCYNFFSSYTKRAQHNCNTCLIREKKIQKRVSNEKNKDLIRKYQQTHKTYIKQYQKEYYNRLDIKNKQSEYYKKYNKTPERRYQNRKNSHNYYLKHPEKVIWWKTQRFRKHNHLFNMTPQEYQLAIARWSIKVKKQFGIKCVICGNKHTQSHHIFERSKYPKLSLNINNGIPLCHQHHYEVHGRRLFG